MKEILPEPLLSASGALVAAGKRKREKEKDGLTEVQRRHQRKVEKRWKEERLAALRKVKTKWTGINPETADMTEAEKLSAYKDTDAYKQRQQRYSAWREEQRRKEEELKAGLMAYYQGRKAGEALTEASFRALGMDIEAWKLYHLWQGHTNDCGPTNIAMMLNAFSGQPGLFARETISEEMYQSWQRVPQELYVPTDWKSVFDKNSWENILETVGGATPPWSVVAAFNQRAASQGIDWSASLQSNGTKEDLLGYLRQGQPVTVLIVRTDGSAHYETVIGYDPEKDAITALDPLKDQGIIEPQEWKEFNGDWSGEYYQRAGVQNDMIIYTPVTPTPSAPDAPTPVPSTPPPPQKSE